jgi:hypothetical protein
MLPPPSPRPVKNKEREGDVRRVRELTGGI